MKQPTAYIALDENIDYEHDTSVSRYVDLINEIRSGLNLPRTTLYWSLYGPRIKDRFHTYEPLSERIQMYDYTKRANEYNAASLDERQQIREILAGEIERSAIQTYRKASVNLKFVNQPSPKILYINPRSLQRVSPPNTLPEHAQLATDDDLSNSEPPSSDVPTSISIGSVNLTGSETKSLQSTIASFAFTQNDTFSLANLKSGILLVRFAKMLNRIRTEKFGLPSYSIYWTAATRNKQLKNPRLGLILYDHILGRWWYTGCQYDGNPQHRTATTPGLARSKNEVTRAEEKLDPFSITPNPARKGCEAAEDVHSQMVAGNDRSDRLERSDFEFSPFERLMHAYFHSSPPLPPTTANISENAENNPSAISTKMQVESYVASVFRSLAQEVRPGLSNVTPNLVGPPTIQVMGSSDMTIPVEDWLLIPQHDEAHEWRNCNTAGQGYSRTYRVELWDWDRMGHA